MADECRPSTSLVRVQLSRQRVNRPLTINRHHTTGMLAPGVGLTANLAERSNRRWMKVQWQDYLHASTEADIGTLVGRRAKMSRFAASTTSDCCGMSLLYFAANPGLRDIDPDGI